MTGSPKLIEVAVPPRPRGAVLVLHGGAARRENMMVSPAQLSVLRMVPIAQRIVAAGHGELAVFRVLNSSRGWNTTHTPVQDVRWALDRVADRLGHRPATCLVGHSLGGRAALLSAGRPEVAGVVALAPWVYPSDVPAGLHGERILIVHGSDDRIADPDRSAQLARRIADAGGGAEVSYVSVRRGTHAMLARHDTFDGLAARFAAVTLLGETPDGVLARAAAGEAWLEV